jgi:type I site-specific restriction endonuclease
MISEGVHIKGVNTLIMLRRTESLNLFNQQLGRCLDANSKESAIVFDLVNNKYSIKIINGKTRIKTNSIFSSSKLIVVPSEQLIIKDYTKDIVEVLEEIAQSLQINYWSKEELDILSKYYLDEGQSISSRLPKRSLQQIRYMACRLGLTRVQRWSDKDVSIMREKYGKVSIKEISLLINKTPGAIQRKANELELTNSKKAGVPWNEEEIKTLRQLYPTASWEVMTSTLNRTKLSIKHKAQNIGLCRDLEISQRYLRKKRD